MKITFTKISDLNHAVSIIREDGSCDQHELNSRSFLRHDLAHYAVELEVPISSGYWGCVSDGAALSGEGVDGEEIWLAESLAGVVQTLMRTNAGPNDYRQHTDRVLGDRSSADLATRIHERIRQLRGHWKATPYGECMQLAWPLSPNARQDAGDSR